LSCKLCPKNLWSEIPGMNFRQRYNLQAFSLKVHAVVLGVTFAGLLYFIALYIAYRDVNVWESFEVSGGFKNPSYTERIYENSVFRTRANTWSNYAFVIVGLYVLAFSYLDWKNKAPQIAGYLVRKPLFGFLFGIGCVYLGLASGLFHASLTRWGQQLDVASMYAAMIALIAMNICRIIPRIPATNVRTDAIFAVLAVIASYLLYHFKWQMSSGVVLPSLILTIGFLVTLDLFRRKSNFNRLWVIASLASLVIAVFCRQMDVAGKFLTPDAIFQGHAIWHVMCASTLACIYMYYRSEQLAADAS